MKILLSILIMLTFSGSSFTIIKVGSVTLTLFRVFFMIFCLFHILNKSKPKIEFGGGKFYKKLLMIFIFFSAITFGMKYSFGEWFSGTIFIFINLCLIYFIVLYSDSMKDINKYMIAYFIGISANILVSIFEYKTGLHVIPENYLAEYREGTWEYMMLSRAPTAFLYNPNNVGVAVLMGIPFIGALEKPGMKKIYSISIHLVWFLLSGYTILATGSRGAILFMMLAIFLYILLRNGAIYKKILIVASLFFVLMFVIRASGRYIFTQLAYSGLLSQNSIFDTFNEGIRLTLIEGGFEAAKNNLFIGAGPGSAEMTVWEQTGIYFPIHNFWIEWLITQGLVGMICFIVLYIRLVIAMIKSKNKESKIVLCSFFIFVIISIIPPTLITLNFVWIIFGFGIAIEKINSKNRENRILGVK